MNNSCPFCGSPDTKPANFPDIHFNNSIFSWHKCRNCKLIFILPILTNDDLSLLYGKDYHDKYYFNYTEDYSPQVRLLKKYPGKKMLDYGCGDGGFLNAFKSENYETTGVEYDMALVTKLNKTFPDTNFLTVDEFWNDHQNTYDIIHLGDVLEHVNDPATMIKKLASKLSAGGYFFIEGPLEQNKSLAFFFRQITFAIKKRIDENKVRVQEPYHVSFSNAHNQQLLFERCALYRLYFQTSEVGWPYIDRSREIRSPWLFFQWLISKISIGFSSLIPNWGNRFIYIGRRVNSE